MESASIRDPIVCRRAAELLRDGGAFGSLVRGVCAVWVDGRNSDAVEAVYKIKGEQRGRRPFGVILSAERLSTLVDLSRIAPPTRDLLSDPDELGNRIGSLCFIRYPVADAVAASLPEWVMSQTDDGVHWVQSWMPDGWAAPRILIDALNSAGVDLPIVTSMNVSGQPELVDQEEGLRFSATHGIALFLADPDAPGDVKGSFPILSVDASGIKLAREGHFPGYLFDVLLDRWHVDRRDSQPAKYPLVATHSEASARQIPPHVLRTEIIERLHRTGND